MVHFNLESDIFVISPEEVLTSWNGKERNLKVQGGELISVFGPGGVMNFNVIGTLHFQAFVAN